MLDWSVRESFTTLYWLNKQTIPRDQYELIWVEMYDRQHPEVIRQADKVIQGEHKARRQMLAQENSWANRATAAKTIIEQALRSKKR